MLRRHDKQTMLMFYYMCSVGPMWVSIAKTIGEGASLCCLGLPLTWCKLYVVVVGTC